MKRPARALLSNARVLRIVSELVQACAKDLADELDLLIAVRCYERGEGPPTNAEDVVTGHLIEYLESNAITGKVSQAYEQNLPKNLPNNQFIIATTLYCKVLDRSKLMRLHEALSTAQNAISAKIDTVSGTLRIGDQAIRFQPNSNMFELLRYVLKDRDAKRYGCSMRELSMELGLSEKRVRDTANNVNRRVGSITDGEASPLLIVTTKDVKVSPQFI